jgi:N-acetyl-alpha-D-muramate 1-phosphate uridylyltransferase
MKAIVLAAGRGERMRPLTDHTPKPLLAVQGVPLIEWHLQALARGGMREVVVNTAWLEEQIVETLGDGARFGLSIVYSREGRDHGGALETAGGLKKALPLLHDATSECFWYVAGDVFTPGFVFDDAAAQRVAAGNDFGHLWMVPNPPQHPGGDFGLEGDHLVVGEPGARFTWSGIALFRRSFVTELMADLPAGTKAKLRPFLDVAITQRRLGATLYTGRWTDVGTPQRLAELNAGPA